MAARQMTDQERIAELEAIISKTCDLSVEQTDKLLAMHDRATAAEARADRLAKGMPDLSSVIGWLASGCEPKHAVDELRIYQARIDAALQQETQP